MLFGDRNTSLPRRKEARLRPFFKKRRATLQNDGKTRAGKADVPSDSSRPLFRRAASIGEILRARFAAKRTPASTRPAGDAHEGGEKGLTFGAMQHLVVHFLSALRIFPRCSPRIPDEAANKVIDRPRQRQIEYEPKHDLAPLSFENQTNRTARATSSPPAGRKFQQSPHLRVFPI